MDPTKRGELTKMVRQALVETWRMGNGTENADLPGVLPLIETQLAWCLQQLRMADPVALPAGKEMNMNVAALREFGDDFGGGNEAYYQLVSQIQYDFEEAAGYEFP